MAKTLRIDSALLDRVVLHLQDVARMVPGHAMAGIGSHSRELLEALRAPAAEPGMEKQAAAAAAHKEDAE